MTISGNNSNGPYWSISMRVSMTRKSWKEKSTGNWFWIRKTKAWTTITEKSNTFCHFKNALFTRQKFDIPLCQFIRKLNKKKKLRDSKMIISWFHGSKRKLFCIPCFIKTRWNAARMFSSLNSLCPSQPIHFGGYECRNHEFYNQPLKHPENNLQFHLTKSFRKL